MAVGARSGGHNIQVAAYNRGPLQLVYSDKADLALRSLYLYKVHNRAFIFSCNLSRRNNLTVDYTLHGLLKTQNISRFLDLST